MNADPLSGQFDFSTLPDLAPLGQTLFRKVPIGTVVVRLSDSQILLRNPAFRHIADDKITTMSALIDTSCVDPKQQEQLRAQVRHAKSRADREDTSELPELVLDLKGADGRIRIVQHYALMFHKQGIAIGIFRDISDIKRKYRALQKDAFTDELTGVGNRRGLMERWNEEIEDDPAQAIGFLMIDLDQFKPINDTYGHATGDNVLRSMARRLRKSVRKSDYVVRMGGDEFGILLPGIESRTMLDTVSNKLLAALRRPVTVDTLKLSLSGSIGGGLYPEDGKDLAAIMVHADQSMYSTKKKIPARKRSQKPLVTIKPPAP
ncbi:diguanylate cyclase [Acetobacter fabarum]|uniref:GGDEF domain-containing protein n=1 Tax=Acetobacter fabarum TaxID=483199 RepID=UPI001404B5DF|nr:GGDEF domain-containing protein [Acetobacter fabarum]NHO42514.1 diguanylate cyclase [Acetobacter fabarum]GBQ30111.1 diguanylate cyclase [Acetobacter fabarum DSM 19596]